jgi:hypothetical protein
MGVGIGSLLVGLVVGLVERGQVAVLPFFTLAVVDLMVYYLILRGYELAYGTGSLNLL